MEGSLDLPPWVDLPDLVTELILEHLALPDYIRFGVVCQKWGSIQKDHRLRHSPHPPPMGAYPLPWLIPYDLHLGTGCECYSPLEKRPRHLRFPTTPAFPRSSCCLASSGGWLLMLNNDDFDPCALPFTRRTFLFNPLTGVVISLPTLSISIDILVGALSSPPFDHDCTIILVCGRSLFLCRANNPGDGWAMEVEIEEWIDSAVYHGGKFYCISRHNVLYIIDPALSMPTLPCLTMDVSALNLRVGDRCRLLEFGGELILVMELYDLHNSLEGFQVFRADFSGEKWVKMDLLGDRVLFLDADCSLSLLASNVGCKKNYIYCTYGHSDYVCRVFDLDVRSWIHGENITHDRFSRRFYWERWFLPTLA